MKNKFLQIALVCFFVGAFTLALAFVSYFSILRDMKSETVTAAAEYIVAAIGKTTDPENEEAFLTEFVSSGRSYTMTYDVIEEVYLYDRENDVLIGTGDTSAVRKDINLSRERTRVRGNSIYTPYAYGEYTIWLQNDAGDLWHYFRDYAYGCVLVFPAAFVLICLIAAVVLHFAKKNKKIFRVLYVCTFLITLIMCLVLISGMEENWKSNADSDINRRLSSIEYVVSENDKLSDERVSEVLEGLDEETLAYARDKAGSDDRLALVYAVIKYDTNPGNDMTELSPMDNIWDQSLPIIDRVFVETDMEKLYRKTLDFLLQSVMLGILAVILLMDILSYDRQKRYSSIAGTVSYSELSPEYKDIIKNADRMKLFLTLQLFANTMLSIVAMYMLKSFMVRDYGDKSGGYISLIILLASAIGCIVVLLVPRLIKLTGHVTVYARIALIICASGAIICFLAKGSTVFIIGYLLGTFGDGFTRMNMILFTMSHPSEKEGLFFLNNITKGPLTGQIIGSVVGGIAASFLDNGSLYFIACLVYVFLTIYTFAFNKTALVNKLPESTNIVTIIKENKEAVVFCALIMMPFGFQNYFFTYMVPLDASAMGLSAVVVSFIYFLRNVCKLYLKYENNAAKHVRKLPLRTSASLCAVFSAVLFFAYMLVPGIWGFILICVGLAFIQVSFNSRIYAHNYELLGNDFNKTFGNSVMIVFSRRIGKTLAPILVQAAGVVLLPIIMLAGGGAYLVSGITGKKTDKGKA